MGKTVPRRERRWTALVALAVVLLGGLVWGTASALSATSPSPGAAKVVLRIGTTQDVDNLNPFMGYSTTAYEVYHLNYDLLVGYRASDGASEPELADSWSTSPDALTWTFKIHPGVKWQDGQPLDGQGRRLHLQLHHQESAGRVHELHDQHQEGGGAR